MPVMSVIDNRTVENPNPRLKTPAQVFGIHVSMDTTKAISRAYQRGRMIRFMLGARAATAVGGGGGSTVARGSRLWSRARMPGSTSNAPTNTKNGSEGTMAALKRLLGGI